MSKSLIFYCLTTALASSAALLLSFLNKDQAAQAVDLHTMHSFSVVMSSSGTLWGIWLAWGVAILGGLGLCGLGLHALSQRLSGLGLGARIGVAVACYMAMMLGLIGAAAFCQAVVFHPAIQLEFTNLLNLRLEGLIALTGVGMLPLTLFLVVHRLAYVVRLCMLPMAVRTGILLAVTFAAYLLGSMLLPGAWQTNLALVVSFGLCCALLYHYVADNTGPDFLVIVLSLFLFSAFSATLLTTNNNRRMSAVLTNYVQVLATKRDTAFAEPMLLRLAGDLNNETGIGQALKPFPLRPRRDSVLNRLNQLTYRYPYLYQYFRRQVYAFENQDIAPLFIDQREDYSRVVDADWNQSSPVPDSDVLRFGYSDDGNLRYLLRTSANRMGDANHPTTLYYAFEQMYPRTSAAYAQLLREPAFRNLAELSNYDYAVVRQKKLVVEHGKVNSQALGVELAPGAVQKIDGKQPNRTDMIARSADGSTTAIVGSATGVWYKPFYLFSIIFAIGSGFWFLLTFINAYLSILPSGSAFALSSKGSLSKRINYANLALLALGFLVIGLLTYRHFNQAAIDSRRADFEERVASVQTYLRTLSTQTAMAPDSAAKVMAPTVAMLAGSLNLDVNLYSPTGRLDFSTREDLRRLGLLTERLPQSIVQPLQNSQQSDRNATEALNGQPVEVRYLPVRNSDNALVAIVGAPYPVSVERVGPEVSNFLGMLAALYVFLLLVAIAATLWLAGKITRSLNLVADRIKEVQFQEKNESLEYRGDQQDEIGSLIGEYNRMVEKLEDSKSKLIRFERDSAWREMARQIAHDIKNPLTTMKLSMQQLERVSNDPNPVQFASYLKKAIARLIEQIDSLAQIASEFSMFANLEIRNKSKMSVNEMVESVFYLFSEQKEVDLRLHLPEEQYVVRGDKNHMIRVLNNVIINSIQAIPSERSGVVTVSVYKRNQNAVIQVSDNGGGIPADIRAHVFEPNFTTKSSGSGLGLAICKKIVEAHEGDIHFKTQDNIGTDFFIELPLLAIDEPVFD
jgi:two-component system, NtrC family, nitrogen regulation sensor histidine kinase NtrY